MVEAARELHFVDKGSEVRGTPDRHPTSPDLMTRFEDIFSGATAPAARAADQRSFVLSYEPAGSRRVGSDVSPGLGPVGFEAQPLEKGSGLMARAVSTLEEASRGWQKAGRELVQGLTHPTYFSQNVGKKLTENVHGDGSSLGTVEAMRENSERNFHNEIKVMNAMSARSTRLLWLQYQLMTKSTTMQAASATASTINKGERRLTRQA